MTSAPRRPRWLVYLLLGRVSNLPTIWTNGMAGILLAGGRVEGSMAETLLALSLLYVSGMYLNDAFDAHVDRTLRPERPIPSGEIRTNAVYGLGFAMMASGILLLGWEMGWTLEPLVWAVLLGALIVYYNYRHKRDPLSPLVMALCRVMVYFIAAASIATAMNRDVLIAATTLMGYLIGLTYVAKQENLNEVKNLWPLILLGLPLIHLFRGANLLIGIAFVGWVIYALSFLIGANRKIPQAVVSLIAGISLLDALIISTIPGQIELALLAVVGFVLTLAFQHFIPGT